MKEVLISIIIPIKDTLPYFKKCLDSMISQTCKNIEIILVDDNSSQDIVGFIRKYNDNRIIYIRNEKSIGPGGARNRGIDVAHGKYIAFCDSDDWVDLNYYETICQYLETSNANIVMTSMKREFANGQSNISKTYMCKYTQPYTINSEIAIRILSKEYKDFEVSIVPACMNKIYRKQFLIDINARFEEGVYFQGVLFSLYTFLRTEHIYCIPKIEYHHFRRPNSVVQSFDNKHIVDFGKCCQTLKKYLTDVDCYELYKYSYQCLCNKYFNLIIQEIFEFVSGENEIKKLIQSVFNTYINNVDISDLFEYLSAEEIRRHLQPYLEDTTLY